MRRILLSVTCIVAAAAFLLAGCGGDSAKARDYMANGDEQFADLVLKNDELSGEIESVFGKLSEDILDGKTPEGESFEKSVTKIKALGGDLVDIAGGVAAQYSKISGLQGVGDYAQYASLRMQVIDIDKKMVSRLDEYLDGCLASLSSEVFDPIEFSACARAFAAEIKEEDARARELEEQAKKLKDEKEL